MKQFSSANEEFLTYKNTHENLFVVVDNTGWLANSPDFNDGALNPTSAVALEISVETQFLSNDAYQLVFKIFVCILVFLVLLLAILICCLVR